MYHIIYLILFTKEKNMEEQKKHWFKEVFWGNESLETREKWFNFYKKLPTILFISIVVLFFIWGIVDPSVFGYHYRGYSYYGYSNYSIDEYGIMRLSSGFLCWLIWQVIGIVIGSLTFIFTKLSLSYKILHIEYLKNIGDKIK